MCYQHSSMIIWSQILSSSFSYQLQCDWLHLQIYFELPSFGCQIIKTFVINLFKTSRPNRWWVILFASFEDKYSYTDRMVCYHWLSIAHEKMNTRIVISLMLPNDDSVFSCKCTYLFGITFSYQLWFKCYEHDANAIFYFLLFIELHRICNEDESLVWVSNYQYVSISFTTSRPNGCWEIVYASF